MKKKLYIYIFYDNLIWFTLAETKFEYYNGVRINHVQL